VSTWMYCCSGMLAGRPAAARWPRCLRASSKRLLHALARHVARDRDVLARLADLVELVDVEDAPLGRLDVEVSGVEQLQQQVLHIFTHVAGFGERGGVADRERHVEDSGKRAGRSVLPQPVGPRSRMFDFSTSTSELSAQREPLVMAMDGHSQHPLGVLLPDDVLIEVGDELAG